MTHIPDSHPRADSLRRRERLAAGLRAGVVTETGMIAHGRGEAFDYLLGETTHDFAREAIDAASAQLALARHPVMTINGNVAALCGEELARLAQHQPHLGFELNLFHYDRQRAARVIGHLHACGLTQIWHHADVDSPSVLPGLASERRFMHPAGVGQADVVLVALEDGDRCEALVQSGRLVIAIDLNPLSRTAQAASISIVDEITRVLPQLNIRLTHDRQTPSEQLAERLTKYHNAKILDRAVQTLRQGTAPKPS